MPYTVAIHISNKNNVDRARTIYIKELPYREKKKKYKRKLQNV